MLDSSDVELRSVCAHRIGNKLRQEGTIISNAALSLDQESKSALLNYFFNHFRKSETVYKLTHPAGKEQNAIAAICSRIFSAEKVLLEESAKAAAHLYDVSDHPRINSGDLYVAKFTNLKFQNRVADAIGFFKADRAERFFSVDFGKGSASLAVNIGTQLKSFDKGALVINRSSSDGYRTLQAVSQSEDAAYWVDRFLKVTPVSLDSEHTEQILKLCRKYSDTLAKSENPTERLNFLDSSYAYLNKNSHFTDEEFSDAIPKELKDSFSQFKEDYEVNQKQPLPKEFKVEPTVLKKQKRLFRSVIHLDDHVEIKINPQLEERGDGLIEKGYDRKMGKSFYKIYFNEES